MGVAFDGALVRLDAARLLGIGSPEGAAAAEEAEAVFERLDAQPYLRILGELRREAEVGPGRRVRGTAPETARA
jgi:hypothetical protein